MDKEKFLKKVDITQKKTTEIRGSIVNATIQIEILIDAILINYFILPKKHESFLRNLLCDKACSSFLKLNALKSSGLLDGTSIKNNLDDLFEIRNKAAHYLPVLSLEEPLILHPKKEPIDLDKLNKEFIQKYDKIKPVLKEILVKLIEEKK
ncbi:hypothetical protein KY338_01720 [Candidatus Woesearchaeota archaeon]|nr:hypothetical protein [Candidatus Woesearchaeota archaeon]MBW3005630.1 hypothetical protein [Candidatus Woesearchaeota archaeon]